MSLLHSAPRRTAAARAAPTRTCGNADGLPPFGAQRVRRAAGRQRAPEELEEALEEAVGEAPDDVGLRLTDADAGHRERSELVAEAVVDVALAGEELRERDPECALDLLVRHEARRVGEVVDERRD